MSVLTASYIRAQIALADTAFTTIPTWTTFECREISWGHSRGNPTEQCQPSTATFVVDNIDGRWDPTSGGGPSGWPGTIKRWLQVRITVSSNQFAFTDRTCFRGFIRNVECYSTEDGAEAVVTAVCQLGVLAQIALEDQDRPAELAGVRASALLDAAGMPSGLSVLEQAGTVVLAAATINGNALAAVQECARAEGGHLWTEGGGLMFTDRHYFYDTASLSGFTLAPEDIENVAIPQTLDEQYALDVGASSGATGTVYTFGSPASGFPIVTRDELDTSAVWDSDASALAEWLQRHGNFADTRVGSVVLSVAHGSDKTVMDAITAGTLKWLDTVEVEFTPPHGSTVTQLCWVESEEHTVSAEDGSWFCTLGLSPYQTDYANRAEDFAVFGTTITTGQVPGI